MITRVPGQVWFGLLVLTMVLAVGCKTVKKQTTGKSYTNVVYLKSDGTLDVADGAPTNGIERGDSIHWVTTNLPPLQFCIVFSPADDPEEKNKWHFQHNRNQDVPADVHISIKPHPIGIANKKFKYTLIQFEDRPYTSPSRSRDGVLSNVVTTTNDPFIIIKNW